MNCFPNCGSRIGSTKNVIDLTRSEKSYALKFFESLMKQLNISTLTHVDRGSTLYLFTQDLIMSIYVCIIEPLTILYELQSKMVSGPVLHLTSGGTKFESWSWATCYSDWGVRGIPQNLQVNHLELSWNKLSTPCKTSAVVINIPSRQYTGLTSADSAPCTWIQLRTIYTVQWHGTMFIDAEEVRIFKEAVTYLKVQSLNSPVVADENHENS